MFSWRIFIILFGCSTLCWSLKFDVNQTHLHRESRQANATLEETCPPLKSSSLDIECSRNGVEVDCTKPVLHGTVAEISCKPYYHIPPYGSVPAPYDHLICQNGLWDNSLMECKPVCGQKNLKRIRRIVGGGITEIGEYPWQVGIYQEDSESDSTKFSLICSGSIISPNMVITVAHCVQGKDPKDYSVAAGKFYRKWDDKRDSNAQFRNISELHIPKLYKGIQNNYANDIAILIMDKPFVLDNLVSPVCVDWTSKIDKQLLVNGSIGYVTGWGFNEPYGDSVDELKHLQLPYVPFDTCYEKSDPDFRPFMSTPDKFCAGRTDDQNVCVGDGGGGLFFQLDGIFYLMGITSVGPSKGASCDVSKFTTFTKFAYHAEWVESILRTTV